MSKEEYKYLASVGLTFPSCEEELIAYEKNHEDAVYELSEDALDPFKILNEVNRLSYTKKSLNKSESYFRRAVLAAKIAHEYYQEWAFGAVKFQKLVYLSENVSSMNFASDYRKQAAGPMDHKFIHSIKKEFEKQAWFSVKQEGERKKWVFIPGDNLTGYETYYQSYFSNESESIQFLIDSFRKWKTDDVELIATLYACWKEAKAENALINDDLLKQKVYKWHEAKKKFKEDQIAAKIRWMEENGVYPQF